MDAIDEHVLDGMAHPGRIKPQVDEAAPWIAKSRMKHDIIALNTQALSSPGTTGVDLPSLVCRG